MLFSRSSRHQKKTSHLLPHASARPESVLASGGLGHDLPRSRHSHHADPKYHVMGGPRSESGDSEVGAAAYARLNLSSRNLAARRE